MDTYSIKILYKKIQGKKRESNTLRQIFPVEGSIRTSATGLTMRVLTSRSWASSCVVMIARRSIYDAVAMKSRGILKVNGVDGVGGVTVDILRSSNFLRSKDCRR